jgi:2-oxo-4-hydroxy-4-carboxy-5-ureidoimidazoline decarboxylase
MIEILPVDDLVDLLEYAEEKWYDCNTADWLEAFEHHPKIGDIYSIQKMFSETTNYAINERAGLKNSSPQIFKQLTKANEEYEESFGYIFIVSDTGKSVEEMLAILQQRIHNDPHDELMIAAAEQDKVTKLRLQKLFS